MRLKVFFCLLGLLATCGLYAQSLRPDIFWMKSGHVGTVAAEKRHIPFGRHSLRAADDDTHPVGAFGP